MNFKQLALVILFASSITLAKAEVKQINKAAASENTVVKAAGKKLSKFSACYSAVNQDTGEVTCLDLPVKVNKKRTRANITMPFVEKDTKGSLVITSGKNAEEQSFFLLILNNERLSVVPQADDPKLPINIGDSLIDAIKGDQGDEGPQGPAGLNGANGARGPRGSSGPKGDTGLACWDLNSNGIKDLATEDTDASGVVDVDDCRGSGSGTTGADGKDGLACWDLNGNGIKDLPAEDTDASGVVDVNDCKGPQGNPGLAGIPGPEGEAGLPGKDGIACWDLNANGIKDLPTEDTDASGTVDVNDCKGPKGDLGDQGAQGNQGPQGNPGPQGNQGPQGNPGPQGNAGLDGEDGIACWDLNANGVKDLPAEDTNSSGTVDVNDCKGPKGDLGDQGPQGIQGPQGNPGPQGLQGPQGNAGPQGDAGLDGEDGIACWDLNANGVKDLPAEDTNSSGTVDVNDCKGPKGDLGDQGPQGIQGPQGNPGPQGLQGPQGNPGPQGNAGLDGEDGIACWDLNANGVKDLPAEDTNSSGTVDVNDCKGPKGDLGDQGPQGIQGPQGNPGPQGLQGPQGNAGPQGDAGLDGEDGIACWDLNANGVKDLPAEDTNSSGTVDVNDCKGPEGDTGDAGPKGDTGATGSKGDTGAQGPKGDKGDTGAQGNDGVKGDIGLACWDLNGNGVKDLPAEDTNSSGAVDVNDCKGPEGDTGDAGPKGDTGATGPKGDTGATGPKGDTGAQGPKGDKGDTGAQGNDGVKGDTGLACWDLNGNGVKDLPAEDTNSSGAVDVNDCKGPEGDTGDAGPKGDTGAQGNDGVKGDTGLACWDLNGNGVKDLPAEDTNSSGAVDINDCKGPQGDTGLKGDTGAAGPKGDTGNQGLQGDPGAKGDAGVNGTDGLACWDLNGNGIKDLPAEDTNSSGAIDILDCKGPQGIQGVRGLAGTDSGGTILGTIGGCPALADDSFAVHVGNISHSVQLLSGRNFTINNITPGAGYTVVVTQYGVRAATKSNVNITEGNVTDVGTITITDCGI